MGTAKCWTFIDEGPCTIEDGWFICVPAGPVWIDLPFVRHNGGKAMIVSLADGHTEMRKFTDRDVTANDLTDDEKLNGVPPLPNAFDLQWLEERSSLPE